VRGRPVRPGGPHRESRSRQPPPRRARRRRERVATEPQTRDKQRACRPTLDLLALSPGCNRLRQRLRDARWGRIRAAAGTRRGPKRRCSFDKCGRWAHLLGRRPSGSTRSKPVWTSSARALGVLLFAKACEPVVPLARAMSRNELAGSASACHGDASVGGYHPARAVAATLGWTACSRGGPRMTRSCSSRCGG
jgi:hypothetical protein